MLSHASRTTGVHPPAPDFATPFGRVQDEFGRRMRRPYETSSSVLCPPATGHGPPSSILGRPPSLLCALGVSVVKNQLSVDGCQLAVERRFPVGSSKTVVS